MAEVVRSVEGDGGKISRREIQEVIAKAVELRALHAALMQGNNQNHNPSPIKFLSASPPLSRPSSHFSAHDYPVFTPVSLSLITLSLIHAVFLLAMKH